MYKWSPPTPRNSAAKTDWEWIPAALWDPFPSTTGMWLLRLAQSTGTWCAEGTFFSQQLQDAELSLVQDCVLQKQPLLVNTSAHMALKHLRIRL